MTTLLGEDGTNAATKAPVLIKAVPGHMVYCASFCLTLPPSPILPPPPPLSPLLPPIQRHVYMSWSTTKACGDLLLLLLRSPAKSLDLAILVRIFAYVTVFNPTIEVVTFRLRGWCMLGVLLLLVFTRLGHECQDLFGPCDGMHVSTD